MSEGVSAYADLQREVMASLRATHPDWSDDTFDFYEARFAELMRSLLGRGRGPRRHSHLKSAVRMA